LHSCQTGFRKEYLAKLSKFVGFNPDSNKKSVFKFKRYIQVFKTQKKLLKKFGNK